MLAFTLTRVLLHGARCFASDEPGPLGGALVSELLAQVARVIPCGGGWGGGAPAPCAKVADAARTSVGPNACGGDVYNTCGWSVGFAEHDELGSHTLIWRRLSLRVGGGGGCLGGLECGIWFTRRYWRTQVQNTVLLALAAIVALAALAALC